MVAQVVQLVYFIGAVTAGIDEADQALDAEVVPE